MMDANIEDKMVHQIEKNLSNQMADNLFVAGRLYDTNSSAIPHNSESSFEDTRANGNGDEGQQVYMDSSQSPTYLSRAEYIKQAREACLRQLYTMPQENRAMDMVVEEKGNHSSTALKPLVKNNGFFTSGATSDTIKESASYRSLIIRTICCFVIFFSIFLIDKFKINWGNFTHNTIREFVVHNDKLIELEEWIVSWIK